MSQFLLYHPKTRTTGRALANLMDIPSGTRLSAKYSNADTIIRWGNIRDIPVTFRAGDGVFTRYMLRREINSQKALMLSGSKLKAMLKWQANGITIPHVWRYGQKQENGHRMSEDFVSDDGVVIKPFLGRSFRHSRGTDIQIFDVGFSMVGHERPDYYIEYIEPKKEYRIHVLAGTVLFAQKKYWGEELFERTVAESGVPRDEYEKISQFVRNNEHGWRFYDIQNLENVPSDVLDVAIKCVATLGLDFGAVDIIFTKSDERGRVFPLEVNTAPGLRDSNLQTYAVKLSDWLN